MRVKGFQAGGVAAGLKKTGEPDFGLLYSRVPASVAGVFTQNRVQAAPVILSRERAGAGTGRAVVVNSGCANCSTGNQGMADAEAMTRMTAQALGISESSVLLASTGVIGQYLKMDKIEAAVPPLAKSLAEDGWPDLARAIMTTDTVPKTLTRTVAFGESACTITAVAKGAGMIRPDMATMLCFAATDAAIAPELLQQMLASACDASFNHITIDGDTSTNDTVLLFANGQSGVEIGDSGPVDTFQAELTGLLTELAKMLVKDGEGATKLVEVCVKGAQSPEAARQVADTVANSALVKTAIFGEDANWGRILAAAGRAGVPLLPGKIDIYFDDVRLVQNGGHAGTDAEKHASKVLKQPEFQITIDLNMGAHADFVWTCDFSIDYVKINADYRS